MSEPEGQTIRLQATVGGMAAASGEVFTLLGELDQPSGVLLIDAAVKIPPGAKERRYEGCAAVSNNPASQERDILFTEADLRDAINAYFDFVGRGLLDLDEAVGRFNPTSAIENDGLDERGRKYRLAADMTNGKLAVIVMCWFALRQAAISQQIDAFKDYDDLDETVTIGMGPGYDGVRTRADGWPE